LESSNTIADQSLSVGCIGSDLGDHWLSRVGLDKQKRASNQLHLIAASDSAISN
jgi:hypothetical protein